LPLFPGYVFARVSPQEHLRVLQVAGVVRFVGFNGCPAPVADSEIECLINGLRGGMRAEPHPYLTEGKRVRVRYGPLAPAEGILVRRKDRCRVVLSLALIMRSVIVEVDEADIEPCEVRTETRSGRRRVNGAFARPNETDGTVND
jgi:transcription antitermination factor NusG